MRFSFVKKYTVKNNMRAKKTLGFTLIELLVVISIIGFLSTLAIVSLKNAREKARDATRLSDLKQVKNALEFYFNDYRSYPSSAYNGKIGVGGNFDTLMAPYLAKTPRDPLGASDTPANSIHYYYYDANQPCNGGEYTTVAIIFASTMENIAGNPALICSVPWTGAEIATEGASASYNLLIGPGQ